MQKREDMFLIILIHFYSVVSIIDNLTNMMKVMIFNVTQVAKSFMYIILLFSPFKLRGSFPSINKNIGHDTGLTCVTLRYTSITRPL